MNYDQGVDVASQRDQLIKNLAKLVPTYAGNEEKICL